MIAPASPRLDEVKTKRIDWKREKFTRGQKKSQVDFSCSGSFSIVRVLIVVDIVG